MCVDIRTSYFRFPKTIKNNNMFQPYNFRSYCSQSQNCISREEFCVSVAKKIKIHHGYCWMLFNGTMQQSLRFISIKIIKWSIGLTIESERASDTGVFNLWFFCCWISFTRIYSNTFIWIQNRRGSEQNADNNNNNNKSNNKKQQWKANVETNNLNKRTNERNTEREREKKRAIVQDA